MDAGHDFTCYTFVCVHPQRVSLLHNQRRISCMILLWSSCCSLLCSKKDSPLGCFLSARFIILGTTNLLGHMDRGWGACGRGQVLSVSHWLSLRLLSNKTSGYLRPGMCRCFVWVSVSLSWPSFRFTSLLLTLLQFKTPFPLKSRAAFLSQSLLETRFDPSPELLPQRLKRRPYSQPRRRHLTRRSGPSSGSGRGSQDGLSLLQRPHVQGLWSARVTWMVHSSHLTEEGVAGL